MIETGKKTSAFGGSLFCYSCPGQEIVPYTKNINIDIAKKAGVRYNKNW
jgi:hypothetical protein